MPPKLTEKAITEQCCDYARLKGFRAERMQSGLFCRPGSSKSRVRVGSPGCCDWLFMRPVEPGRADLFWCEFKATGKLRTVEQTRAALSKPSRAKDQKNRRTMRDQLAFKEEMTDAGFLVLSTDSVDGFMDWLGVNFA